MNRTPSRRLQVQIVVPLAVAALIVSVAASALSLRFVDDITKSWAADSSRAVTAAVVAGVRGDLQRVADAGRIAAQSPSLADSISHADTAGVDAMLLRMNSAMGLDVVALVGPDGRVTVAEGPAASSIASVTMPADKVAEARSELGHVAVRLFGKSDLAHAMRPVQGVAGPWYVFVGRLVDDSSLTSAVGTDVAGSFAVVRGDGSIVASRVSTGDETAVRRLSSPDRALAAAVASTKPTEIAVGGTAYEVWSQPLAPFAGDGSAYRLVSFVRAAAPESSRLRTSAFIFGWTVLAFLVLAGFGLVVARRVAQPVEALTESARAVAAGDFSTKVPVTGVGELSELTEAFNQMTDSLKDRTESLTRKVIELTMLREMSRSMGTTLELEVLLESVMESAVRMFDADSGYVVLRDRDSGQLRLGAWHGGDGSREAPDETVLRSSLAEWVVREGRPLIFNPSPGDGQEGSVDHATGAVAALSVPLVSSEGTIGAITVGSHVTEHRFSADDVRLLSTVANQLTIAIDNVELFSSLQESYLNTVRSLAAAVDAKDTYTRGHSEQVAQYAITMGERLGLSHEQLTALEMAAYLHDIGKIGIPETILSKPGRLDPEEYAQMRHHPLIGANILSQVAFPWPIAPIVRHHHERWDGAGYPAGLRGEEIPFLARILVVADSYEAMTSDRPYRRAMPTDKALEELVRNAGTHFDPRLVEVFAASLHEEVPARTEPEKMTPEGFQHEEVRAVFVSLCDGMFAGFRRLGGPRLASNVEEQLNNYFAEESLPYFLSSGHLAIDWGAATDGRSELDDMRRVVERLAEHMERVSGRGLVDHFYAQALSGLSERLRELAEELKLYRRA